MEKKTAYDPILRVFAGGRGGRSCCREQACLFPTDAVDEMAGEFAAEFGARVKGVRLPHERE